MPGIAGSGYFTVSFDFELIWGTIDLAGLEGFRRSCEREREHVVERVVALLAQYEIPATWYTVGHLMLECCAPKDGVKHPEIVRPSHKWSRGDWFSEDPGGDEIAAPLFFARSLLRKVRSCHTRQEIGCHSFSHVVFGDPGCSPECAESEVLASLRAAEKLGLRPCSFGFPRNRVGHLDVLARYGFESFRGPEPHWYGQGEWPLWWGGRLMALVEATLAVTPPVVWPRRTSEGIVDVPGSMVYLPRHGIRRLIPVSQRVRRGLRGLRRAARTGRVFHLWMHPTNLAYDTEAMLAGLERIFEYAAELRDLGRIRCLTVSEMARLATPSRAS
jgi:peptidoglycan/xylan/chitin deacetylase (PgdA/CDA1 family)